LMSILQGNVVLAVIMLALFGSLAGFLLFNFHPAKIFMGDCGSLFLGFIIATSSILTAAKSEALVGIGLPILQINHPSVVLRRRDYSLESITAKLISILLMGKYHRKLIVSFYDGDVGPIVRRSLTTASVPPEDFFVVYLKPGYRKTMLRALKRLAIHNVVVFPDPNRNIIDDLTRCRAVISSAGHQFMSEALVLKKPVFVVPQTGQYEQWLNARMLEDSGWGTYATMNDLDSRLSDFVHNIERYPMPAKATGVRYRMDNELDRAVRKIDRFLIEAGGV